MNNGLRTRLTTTVVVVSALALALLIAGFNIALHSSLDGDANNLLHARAQAALEGLHVKGNSVRAGESSDRNAQDAPVWIYAGGRLIERPLADRQVDELARELGGAGSGTREDGASDTRLLARTIRSEGGPAGTVIAAIALEPYERTAQRALIGSIALGVLVLALIFFVARSAITRSLEPVAAMTRTAEDWSAHDLDRRFNAGPAHDELTQLAATFDHMLDRMATMVRHERNFSAEMSHELRTPLASIAAESELALRRERTPDEYRAALATISDKAAELTRIAETLLEAARAETGAEIRETGDLTEILTGVATSTAKNARRYGVELVLPAAERPLAVQGSPEILKRILIPIVENALGFARRRVAISIEAQADAAVVSVLDDGPGFSPADIESAFEPGGRGSAERNPKAPPSSGLGLTLANRLAHSIGGEVVAEAGQGGTGGLVRVRLLAAQLVGPA